MASDGLPVVLITNDDGIEAAGLTALVKQLVARNKFQVCVCAPDQERSGAAHSISTRDALEVQEVVMEGATAFSVTGTPADCVSLALSGHLFQWQKPSIVLSGINKGANCGLHIVYSGTVAGAREAFMAGVPSIAFSLDWKSESAEDEIFSAAAALCVPIVEAALEVHEMQQLLSACFLNVDIPAVPSSAKGVRITRQGTSRQAPRWAPSVTRRKSLMMGNPMGAQMAQMGLAAAAAGAARRPSRPSTEVQSVAPVVHRIPSTLTSEKRIFRNEGSVFEPGMDGEDIDSKLLQDGWITITPLGLVSFVEESTRGALQEWATAIQLA